MLEFVLHNNNFKLIGDMYHQILGTAIETKCAFLHACLIIDYKDHFSSEEINIIKKIFKRCMDDGFLLWPSNSNIDNFWFFLNNLHPSRTFLFKKQKELKMKKGKNCKSLFFLDATVILNKTKKFILANIYYKKTNAHDYLPFNSYILHLL